MWRVPTATFCPHSTRYLERMSEKARMNTCNAREAAPVPVTPWEMMFLHGKHFLFLSVLLYNDRFARKATSKDTGKEMHRERFGEGQAATFSRHCQLQLTSTWSTLSEMFKYNFNFLFCYLVLCVSFRSALCYNPHEEVRGQLCGVSSFFPPFHGFWKSNMGYRDWAVRVFTH